jgi:RNA polymerase sigma factor (TIGR02999 family)
MREVTLRLSDVDNTDLGAADDLLPLVYRELRRLASHRLAQLPPGQTLEPTALVHEAYVRLAGTGGREGEWDSRGHFFVAASEAMRRILVESARRKGSQKRGGHLKRQPLDESAVAVTDDPSADLIDLDEALDRLATTDGTAARLVELRYFSGLTQAQVAEVLDLPRRSADRLWAFARSWLHRELQAR